MIHVALIKKKKKFINSNPAHHSDEQLVQCITEILILSRQPSCREIFFKIVESFMNTFPMTQYESVS